MDGVFDATRSSWEWWMKQLQHLNRLTDELHLLFGLRGNLVLEDRPFRLDELIQEAGRLDNPAS